MVLCVQMGMSRLLRRLLHETDFKVDRHKVACLVRLYVCYSESLNVFWLSDGLDSTTRSTAVKQSKQADTTVRVCVPMQLERNACFFSFSTSSSVDAILAAMTLRNFSPFHDSLHESPIIYSRVNIMKRPPNHLEMHEYVRRSSRH